MTAHLRANAVLIVSTLLLCSVGYPLAVYVAAFVFPTKATGGIATVDGKPIGSLLIAQEFKGNEYFQPRPSAVGYNASGSGGSNFGPNNPKLRGRVAQQLGPIVKYRHGQPVGPDIEKWFKEKPDRLKDWADKYPTLAGAWLAADPLNTEYVTQWLKDHPEIAESWKKAHPDATDGPKPEDVLGDFFASFAAAHPGAIPDIVEMKKDDKVEKKIEPVEKGDNVQALFFDMWLQEHPKEATEIEPVPADMVTTSGSGLDPHITLRNARYQLERVAGAWAGKTGLDGMPEVRTHILLVLNEKAFTPLLGFGGEPLVNVLEVNLALHERFGSIVK